MAIIFDRLSYAVSGVTKIENAHVARDKKFHLLPQKWDDSRLAIVIEKPIGFLWNSVANIFSLIVQLIARPFEAFAPAFAKKIIARPFLIIGMLLLLAAYFFGGDIKWMNTFPRDLEISFRDPIDHAINWLTVNPTFIGITKYIRTTIFLYFLDPLDSFLSDLPWWYVMAAMGLIVWVSVNWRFALITLVFLLFLGAAGLWEVSMFTLAGTAVSVTICLLIGVPLGIIAAYSRVVDAVMRPILDAMQTMPAFVYLIPALFFFGGNKTTAIIATVIYAIPPVIRLTTLGLRQLPVEIDEVANSFGSSTLQTLFKIKLPMASPSIMLGLNQAVVFALAMQAITPLVAGLGLGKEVFDAMNRANMGAGLAAGIGIVLLTIVLDRLTQGWTAKQRKALGL